LNTTFRKLYGKDREYLLERDVKGLGEVVIVGSCKGRTWRMQCASATCIVNVKSSLPVPGQEGLKIFPNPVQKGASANLLLDNRIQKPVFIRLIGAGGNVLVAKSIITPQSKTCKIQADPRWEAGIYFVQAIDEKGKIINQQQLIIL
jgi:hypothetical protein